MVLPVYIIYAQYKFYQFYQFCAEILKVSLMRSKF